MRRFPRLSPRLNIAFGITSAIVAGVLLLGYISSLLRENPGGRILHLPVASRDIETGFPINSESIAKKEIPEEYTVPGSIRNSDKIKGSRALRFIGKGEPFTKSSISSGSASGSLATRIPDNFRAYTLNTTRCSSMGPELKAGDYVDVLLTALDPPRTSTILSRRLVISIGSGTRDDVQSADSMKITLLVTPKEAEILAQAEVEGQVSVSLCPLSPENS
ncbi:MAG: Flp pilus assembly protein CpaB [Actinomycetota bacterium]|nr:Flp pilus assembly protein CpaB [Actinomycetota bacterium]